MSTINRLTQQALSERTLGSLGAIQQRMAKLQGQITTGKAIDRVSDDPTGAGTALRLRQESSRLDQWISNARDGMDRLATADGQLQSINTQVLRVRNLMIQAMSTVGSAERQGIADEIEQLRDSMISSANAQHMGRPVFGGATSGGAAYDAAGTYVGDTTQITRSVGTNDRVRVDVNGPEVFGAAGSDLFTVLSSIIINVRTAPNNLTTDLAGLDTVSTGIRTAMGTVGASLNRLQSVVDTAELRLGELQNRISGVEDVDLTQAVMELTMEQTAYEAALRSTVSVIQPSLLDFLR